MIRLDVKIIFNPSKVKLGKIEYNEPDYRHVFYDKFYVGSVSFSKNTKYYNGVFDEFFGVGITNRLETMGKAQSYKEAAIRHAEKVLHCAKCVFVESNEDHRR